MLVFYFFFSSSPFLCRCCGSSVCAQRCCSFGLVIFTIVVMIILTNIQSTELLCVWLFLQNRTLVRSEFRSTIFIILCLNDRRDRNEINYYGFFLFGSPVQSFRFARFHFTKHADRLFSVNFISYIFDGRRCCCCRFLLNLFIAVCLKLVIFGSVKFARVRALARVPHDFLMTTEAHFALKNYLIRFKRAVRMGMTDFRIG